MTPGTHELAGELTRLTLGSGNETMPSVSADGKLVFANHSYSAGIWEALPGDASARIDAADTQDRAMNYRPSVSADGSKLAYISNRTGNFEVWLRDLASGKEAALTRSEKAEVFVAISRDGSQVAFWDGAGIYLASTGGGAPRLLCEKCGRPDGWTQDGKVIIAPWTGSRFNRSARSRHVIIHQDRRPSNSAHNRARPFARREVAHLSYR